jgi:hypothetical protein
LRPNSILPMLFAVSNVVVTHHFHRIVSFDRQWLLEKVRMKKTGVRMKIPRQHVQHTTQTVPSNLLFVNSSVVCSATCRMASGLNRCNTRVLSLSCKRKRVL